jgi:hypothetical protein
MPVFVPIAAKNAFSLRTETARTGSGPGGRSCGVAIEVVRADGRSAAFWGVGMAVLDVMRKWAGGGMDGAVARILIEEGIRRS